jgi:N utilization substance protein A
VKIDMAALKGLVREKGLSLDLVVETIESALLTAYRHTDGAASSARVVLDRKAGDAVVLAQELGEDGEVLREWDDTPAGFGRIAATTAKQVVLQRLREAESEQSYGEYAGREGDVVSGVVQQAPQRPGAPLNRNVMIKLGAGEDALEAVLPPAEQVPGESYAHGTRLKCRVVGVSRGPRGAQVTVSRTHPDLVRGLFALEVPEIADGSVQIAALAREAGHRTKIAVRSTVAGLNAKGACIGPVGARVRAVTTELHGEKIDIVDWSDDPARFVAHALSPARVSSVTVVDPVQRSARV